MANSAGNSWDRLELERVGKVFSTSTGARYSAVRDASLTILRGEFVCILGPSGCGKSTLLNMIAGFDAPTSGSIYFDSSYPDSRSEITSPSTDRVVVFQDVSNALFPWLTVRENIDFGPRMNGTSGDPIMKGRVDDVLELVSLTVHAGKFPFELSGGMKQRVQIARALVNDPAMLLMDEPFAALDAITKRYLQDELARVCAETLKTVVYITHDIIEALLLGSKVAVMTSGPNGTIRSERQIDLDHPRDPTSPEFVALARELQAMLHAEVAL